MNRFTVFVFMVLMVFLLNGCASASRPAVDAVTQVPNLLCESCRSLQEKHYTVLTDIADTVPFPMKVESFGFLKHKDKVYVSLDLVGSNYNSIQTTTTTRLSNEFFGKYKTTASLIFSDKYSSDIDGVRVLLGCLNYNFVSDKYGLRPNSENLELFTDKEVLDDFLQGDITAQDLIDASMVYINGQGMNFNLQMM